MIGFVAAPFFVLRVVDIGNWRKRTIKLRDEILRSKHVLVLGSTGSGKTTAVLEPSIKADIDAGYGLIFITAKEELDFLSRILSYSFEACRAKDLRIFSLSKDFPSHSYNPLSYGDATSLRDMLFEAFTWDSPYYRDQAKSALLHVLEALVETGKSFCLRDLYYVISSKLAMEALAKDVKCKETKYHLDGYLTEWKTFHENTRGLIANLEDYAGKSLVNRLSSNQPEIDLFDAYQTNKIIIFVLNSLQYGETAKCLGRMILQNLRYMSGLIASRGDTKKFFPCYIDEFHHLVYPQFFSMVAQCRSSNIGLVLSTQSFADLRSEQWDITTQVVQNTNTKVILRQNDADSAELVAKLSGTKKHKFHTQQYEESIFWGKNLTGLGTVKDEEKFVIHPNKIKRFKVGEGVILSEGLTIEKQFMPPAKPLKTHDWNQWFDYMKDWIQKNSKEKETKDARPSLDVFAQLSRVVEARQGRGIIRKSTQNKKETDALKGSSGIEAIKDSLTTSESKEAE